MNDLNDLYLGLKVGQNLGFSTEFKPKFLEMLEKQHEREIKTEIGRITSGLFKQS